jgi:peptide-methionine (S)-S-oxide reductase
MSNEQEIFFAGGCLWGVQEFFRHVPGVITTEAGRANGTTDSTCSEYDGYAECVRTIFDTGCQSVTGLMRCFFEIIDPHSVNRQGADIGIKYRTGVYSHHLAHLIEAQQFIDQQPNSDSIVVEVLPLSNFVASDAEHQDRLLRCPDDYCHLDKTLLHKYKR